MGLTRHNAQSLGFMVAQAHDADFMGVSYDWSSRPVNFAGRHGIVVDADGIPVHRQVSGTAGPIGQWLVVPGAGGDSGRSLGQWGQIFPAKIYDDSPLTAAVILNQAGDLDTTLGGIFVATLPGADTPAIDAVGVIFVGSSLAGQEVFFFEGGGGSATAGLITGNSGAGVYTFNSVNPATNVVDGVVTGGVITELSRVTIVPAGSTEYVAVHKMGGAYYFEYHLENCA